jgi:hypothetical protein
MQGCSTMHVCGKESPPPEETARLPGQAARSGCARLGAEHADPKLACACADVIYMLPPERPGRATQPRQASIC